MKFLRKLFMMGALLALFGCQTTQTLYDWGEYDSGLYEYYHDPVAAEAFPTILEAHLIQVEESGQKPAPGLYAEVGTFNLKAGNLAKAISYYKKESDTWPESKPLMDAMVQNLERQSQGDKK
ncbi:DUF4810 domain-containing protein [Photobacterium sanguinicancri]|uniref:DUF4810 domain-containing protein n=1 Tax=Photobacterium sanguinicancri TaxID=875932 RepID=UPI0026E1D722|nr:DUF4810 domain-containing protein [Photobacterium sanguinicancri]MDO6498929.1 DUF4810 domain-containing protein [Photobacterium sanguinicancri]